MALNLNKNLKLYYSIREVAEMFGVNESTLRYWEQEFSNRDGADRKAEVLTRLMDIRSELQALKKQMDYL